MPHRSCRAIHHIESWLSRCDKLKRFVALREVITLFMAMKDNDVPELDDPTFIANLAILTDLKDNLNMLAGPYVGCYYHV